MAINISNRFRRTITGLDLAAGAILHEDLPTIVKVNNEPVTTHFDEKEATVTVEMGGGVPLAALYMAGGEVEVWPLWKGAFLADGNREYDKCVGTVPYDDPELPRQVSKLLDEVIAVYYRTRG